jgi:RNA polymerase-binding transcription factor DksA
MTEIAERPTHASPLTARQLAGVRAHLAADREQTIRLIDSVTLEMDAFVTARRDTATDDEHDPEGPTLAFERSQSEAVLSQSMQHLSDIDAALVRMDEGTFGTCKTCGGPIALGRLQARPQATQCISCAGRNRS